MTSKLRALEKRIAGATGQDRDLDRAIAETVDIDRAGGAGHDYTASVDTCLSLIGRVLPDWHWHVGHGPTGILPYASLSKTSGLDEETPLRVEASAPTVPLALLHAAVFALIADQNA